MSARIPSQASLAQLVRGEPSFSLENVECSWIHDAATCAGHLLNVEFVRHDVAVYEGEVQEDGGSSHTCKVIDRLDASRTQAPLFLAAKAPRACPPGAWVRIGGHG